MRPIPDIWERILAAVFAALFVVSAGVVIVAVRSCVTDRVRQGPPEARGYLDRREP